MKINDMFPSKYLKASDAESPLTLTISKVTTETMKARDGSEESKPVVFFSEQDKGMVLNKTNARTLSSMYGEETNEWVGKRATLISVEVDAFGELQKALRFKNEPPVADRKTLLSYHQKLFKRAKELGVDDLDTFALEADADEQTIIEVGKSLRIEVNAAEAFLSE